MAEEVIKKDGTKQPFDAEKIKESIRAAANLTDISEERKNELVEKVGNATIEIANAKKKITTSEIKEKILKDLDAIEPSVSAAWRRYEQEKTGIE